MYEVKIINLERCDQPILRKHRIGDIIHIGDTYIDDCREWVVILRHYKVKRQKQVCASCGHEKVIKKEENLLY